MYHACIPKEKCFIVVLSDLRYTFLVSDIPDIPDMTDRPDIRWTQYETIAMKILIKNDTVS